MSTGFERLEPRRMMAFGLGTLVHLDSESEFDDQVQALDVVQVLDVANDRDGHVYVAGRFTGIVDFDTRRNHEFLLQDRGFASTVAFFRGDAFLAKYTADGRLLWARQLTIDGDGSTATGAIGRLAVDGNGDTFLSGSFDGQVDFNPLRGRSLMQSTAEDGFVWALNADGQLIWATKVPNLRDVPIGTDANAVTIDALGDVVVTGEMHSSGDEVDGIPFVARLDRDTGAVAINKLLPITFDAVAPHAIAADRDDGFVYVAGYQADVEGTRDTFVTKINRKGNVIWYRELGGAAGRRDSQGIAVDRDGSAFVAGVFSGDATFGGTVRRSAGGRDAFLTRLDSDGDVEWSRAWGGAADDAVDDVAIDTDGQLIVGGRFTGVVDFDPGSATRELDAGGSQDFFVARFSSGGTFVQASAFGGKVGRALDALAVCASRRGDVFAGGTFGGAMDFDPTRGVAVLDTGGDTSNGFWLRLHEV